MKKIIKLSSLVIFICLAFVLLNNVNQADAMDQDIADHLKAAAGEQGANLPEPTTPTSIATRIIRVLLGLLGTVFLALTVYGGFLWMTAGGNDEQLTQAKKTLTRSIIGLIIITSSYSISLFAERIATGKQSGQEEYCIETETGPCCYGDPCWTW